MRGARAMLSRFLTIKEQWVLLALAAAITVGAVAVYASRVPPGHERRSSSRVEVVPAPRPSESPPPEVRDAIENDPVPHDTPPVDQVVRVAVAGAVRKPGVYQLDTGSCVQDLIRRAGGLDDNADASDINLAAALLDSSTLVIPWGPEATRNGDTLVLRGRRGAGATNPPEYTISQWRPPAGHEPAATAGGHASSTRKDSRIDLNSASSEELESLKGIGPKLAQEIIRFRREHPFDTPDDLVLVRGIGPKKLEDIRPFVVVVSAR